MFQVRIGISRSEMLEMTVPEMVDMLGYYREVTRDG